MSSLNEYECSSMFFNSFNIIFYALLNEDFDLDIEDNDDDDEDFNEDLDKHIDENNKKKNNFI